MTWAETPRIRPPFHVSWTIGGSALPLDPRNAPRANAGVKYDGRVTTLKAVSVPRGVTTPCQDPSPRIRALWFSRSLDERREACRRCRLCPIVHTCGEAAEANQERHGVWGGKDFTKGDRPRRRGAA